MSLRSKSGSYSLNLPLLRFPDYCGRISTEVVSEHSVEDLLDKISLFKIAFCVISS